MTFLEHLSVDDFESAAQPPNKLIDWLHQAGFRVPKLFEPRKKGISLDIEEERTLFLEEEAPAEH